MAAAAFVRNEPPPEQNDAHWLLDFYSSFMSCSADDTTERALECLAKVCADAAVVAETAAAGMATKRHCAWQL
jgi:hypothetical protein